MNTHQSITKKNERSEAGLHQRKNNGTIEERRKTKPRKSG